MNVIYMDMPTRIKACKYQLEDMSYILIINKTIISKDNENEISEKIGMKHNQIP
jgi:hypothetical protein